MHVLGTHFNVHRIHHDDLWIDGYRYWIDFFGYSLGELRQQQLRIFLPRRVLVSLQQARNRVFALIEFGQFVLRVGHPVHRCIEILFLRISGHVLGELFFGFDPLRVVDQISAAAKHRIRGSVTSLLRKLAQFRSRRVLLSGGLVYYATCNQDQGYRHRESKTSGDSIEFA